METLTMEQIKADEIIEIISNIIQKQLNREEKIGDVDDNESK
ncbi:MAG: hypothetical protein RR192_00150 [Peptostreptococcaceae bacterium]